MKYIASCSFGKDSLAMVLYLIENNMPLDEVVFYDTGMEFDAIYRNAAKLIPILEAKGIKYTELKPENTFLYDMLEKPVESKQKGKHNGYGWCGGVCRWGTTFKLKALDKYAEEQDAIVYIGIAADEVIRLRKKRKSYKRYPLAKKGIRMAEADCLDYCRKRGWDWHEQTSQTESGYIDLYDILDRVSCWCCCNKNRKELKNIYKYLPIYWAKLKKLQSQIERPMKKFTLAGFSYGNIYDMEKVFDEEIEEELVTLVEDKIEKGDEQ